MARNDVRQLIEDYEACRLTFQAAKTKLRQVLKTAIQKPEAAAASDQQPELFTPAEAAHVSEPEVYTVLQVMRRFSHADEDAARQLVKECRAQDPRCTVVAIAETLEVKGPLAEKYDNPVGFLLTAVPKVFKGGVYEMPAPKAGSAEFWKQRSGGGK